MAIHTTLSPSEAADRLAVRKLLGASRTSDKPGGKCDRRRAVSCSGQKEILERRSRDREATSPSTSSLNWCAGKNGLDRHLVVDRIAFSRAWRRIYRRSRSAVIAIPRGWRRRSVQFSTTRSAASA
jgi:hypothetical protein